MIQEWSYIPLKQNIDSLGDFFSLIEFANQKEEYRRLRNLF